MIIIRRNITLIRQGDRVEVVKTVMDFYKEGASGIVVMRLQSNLLVKFDRGEYKHTNGGLWHVHVANCIKIKEEN